jgi:hypothetical protein
MAVVQGLLSVLGRLLLVTIFLSSALMNGTVQSKVTQGTA